MDQHVNRRCFCSGFDAVNVARLRRQAPGRKKGQESQKGQEVQESPFRQGDVTPRFDSNNSGLAGCNESARAGLHVILAAS